MLYNIVKTNNANNKKGENNYMFTYKINIMEELAKKGYTVTMMRKNKIMSQATMQRLRRGEPVNITTINDICVMLRCQPSDIIQITPSDEEKIKFF